MSHAAVITGQGSAVPTTVLNQQELWDDYFGPRLGGDRLSRFVFLASGVRQRHGAVDPRHEDVAGWGTGARMARYVPEAQAIGREAVSKALADAGLTAADVGLFVVVSCTGYATPGLDITIAHDLGMPASVRRLLVGHMGCYAAIPGLGAAADFVRSRGLPAVVLCVELPSLHVQDLAPGADSEQVVAHALFADAAAAIVLEPDARAGLEVLDTTSATAPDSAPLMTWDVTDHGFRMGLSRHVPEVLSRHVVEATASLLDPFDLTVPDVAGWAVHPGGPRIVQVVTEKLGLAPEFTADSDEVLAEYGNCSSGTVLLVLDRLRRRETLDRGDAVVMMAFGPGLTLCTVLLRAR